MFKTDVGSRLEIFIQIERRQEKRLASEGPESSARLKRRTGMPMPRLEVCVARKSSQPFRVLSWLTGIGFCTIKHSSIVSTLSTITGNLMVHGLIIESHFELARWPHVER